MAQELFHVESQVEDVEVGVGLLQVYVGEVSVEVAYWWVGVGNKNIPRALLQKTGLKCSVNGLRNHSILASDLRVMPRNSKFTLSFLRMLLLKHLRILYCP